MDFWQIVGEAAKLVTVLGGLGGLVLWLHRSTSRELSGHRIAVELIRENDLKHIDATLYRIETKLDNHRQFHSERGV